MLKYWIVPILAAFLAQPGKHCVVISFSLSENIFILGSPSAQAVNIPRNLVDCYRGNETLAWSPNTLQVFLELIRKLEDAYPTSMDMRRLSTQIFHL
jgi:hypothetical protein